MIFKLDYASNQKQETTREFNTLEELIEFTNSVDRKKIIVDTHYNPPLITVYDDYIE